MALSPSLVDAGSMSQATVRVNQNYGSDDPGSPTGFASQRINGLSDPETIPVDLWKTKNPVSHRVHRIYYYNKIPSFPTYKD